MDFLNEKVGKIFKTYNTLKESKAQVEVISNSNSTDDCSEKIPLYSNSYKIIDKKYLYFKDLVIGSGSFGKVFYGIDINQKKEYAIKFENSELKKSVLNEELKIYNDLQGGEGIPKIHWSGKFKNNKVFIMDLLGPSLDKFYKISKTKTLNLETTINFGQQMVKRIQYMHSKNYLHRDIKPNNFLLGKYNRNFNSNLIYIVDFGLSKEFKDPITKEHYPYKENRRFVGTPRYASVNTHIGIKQSRRDDLESIAYVLIFFLKSELPWQGVRAKTKSEKKEKIKLSKISTDAKKLCDDLPPQIYEFLSYTKNLGYYDEPNYNYLMSVLENLKIEKKFSLNYRFVFWEWNEEFLSTKALQKLNTKEAKSEYALLEKNFKCLYEGYPIQDFEEFLDSLISFKCMCQEFKLNEEYKLTNSRIILNKNYIQDPNGDEADLKNENNIVYSIENNFASAVALNLKFKNSNFTALNDHFTFSNAINNPNNNLNNNYNFNLISSNAKFLSNIGSTNEKRFPSLLDSSRNNYFSTAAKFAFEDSNNPSNNKTFNYSSLINNTKNNNNKSNINNANYSLMHSSTEKIKLLNPFAVYSATDINNIPNARKNNNNLIVNKLNFKIENPYAEKKTACEKISNNRDNFNINLSSLKHERDLINNSYPLIHDEKISDHFFKQFFYKETLMQRESNNNMLLLGNKRLNNQISFANEGVSKEKTYSFLKK